MLLWINLLSRNIDLHLIYEANYNINLMVKRIRKACNYVVDIIKLEIIIMIKRMIHQNKNNESELYTKYIF